MRSILLGLALAILAIDESGADIQLWGVLPAGGDRGKGVLYKLQPEQDRYEVLHHFSGPDGAAPRGALLFARNGKLYGTTCEGGQDNGGVLFAFAPQTRTLTVERHFTGGQGRCPQAGLMEAPDGRIYGTATYGGRGDRGVVFRFDPRTHRYAVIHRFDGNNGANPRGHLLWYEGRIYGLSWQGGLHNKGTLFSFAPDESALAIHHDFDVDDGGTFPFGGLIDGGDGKLYGFTATGGGWLFAFDPAANLFTPLVQTTGILYGSPALGRDGSIYGTSAQGGSWGRGFLFAYDPASGTYARRFSFVPWGPYGWSPDGSLTAASDGRLYGLTAIGGTSGAGNLFRFSPASDTYWPQWQLAPETGNQPGGASPIEAIADAPSTRVVPGLCERELSLYRALLLDAVPGADRYEVEVYADPGLDDLLVRLDSHGRRIALESIDSIGWGGTYYVRARAIEAGMHSGLGPVCELRIMDEPAAVPATRIRQPFLDQAISPYTRVSADAVVGATRYDFEVGDAAGLLWSGSGPNGFSLADAGLIDWERSYVVRTRAAIGAMTGSWSDPVAIRVMPWPLEPPLGTVRPADCGSTRSIYQRIGAVPVPGATAYRFELRQGDRLVARVESPTATLSLEEIDGVRWWGQYNVRVRADIGPVAGELGPVCGLGIAPSPVMGLYSQRLIGRHCGAVLSPTATIRTQNGVGVSEYEWVFYEDPDGRAEIARARSAWPSLSLAKVEGLAAGSSFWVAVRGNVGPFEGPFGGLCAIHLESTPP